LLRLMGHWPALLWRRCLRLALSAVLAALLEQEQVQWATDFQRSRSVHSDCQAALTRWEAAVCGTTL
jgi:hypothetical protein